MLTFEEKATQRLRALQKELDDLVRANLECVTTATKSVDQATETVAGLAENQRIKISLQRRNEQQLGDTVRALTDMPSSDRQLTEETARLKEVESQLEKKKAETAAASAGDELGDLVRAMDQVKHELATLRRERDELSTMAGVAGQLSLTRRDADEKEENAGKTFEACKPRLAALFGEEEVRSEPWSRAPRLNHSPPLAGRHAT